MKEILKNTIIEDLCNTGFTGIMYVTFDSGKITEVSRKPDDSEHQVQNVKNIIAFWRMRFRVLHDWEITYDDLAEERKNCVISDTETKQATIYGFHRCFKTDQENPNNIKNYILHEIIHIAYEASRNDRELNEIFTQDLTEMLKYINKL